MNLNPRASHAFPAFPTSALLTNFAGTETFAGPLAELRAVKDGLQSQVRRGEITLRVAREALRSQIDAARGRIQAEGSNLQAQQHPLAQRLKDALTRRQEADRSPSLENLQRETNRLLKQNLLEQQILARHGEFEARTFTRSTPAATPAPTVDSLITFFDRAVEQNDGAAVEWARRQLDAMRPQVVSEHDLGRIDRASERPDRPNPRIIDRYIQALAPAETPERERFVSEALASGEADACIAAYLLARDVEDGIRVRWVRQLADGLAGFPAEALDAIQQIEARRRERLTEEIDRQLQGALHLVDQEAKLPDSIVPSAGLVEHQARISSLPVAQLGETIGLAVSRRGPGPLPTSGPEHSGPHHDPEAHDA